MEVTELHEWYVDAGFIKITLYIYSGTAPQGRGMFLIKINRIFILYNTDAYTTLE